MLLWTFIERHFDKYAGANVIALPQRSEMEQNVRSELEKLLAAEKLHCMALRLPW